MKEFFRQIVNDLRHGSNLDLYATMVVCLSVALMSVFGVAKMGWVLAAILPNFPKKL
jgi:hypothetical protein